MPKFRYDKLIEIKENALNEKKKELKKTVDLYEGLSRQIVYTEDNIRKEFNKTVELVLDSNDIYILREHIMWLEEKKKRLIEEKKATGEKIDALRSQLEDILKEIKILETLKTRKLAAMRKAYNKKEQKKLDELAIRVNIEK